jgi:hypothetical protein
MTASDETEPEVKGPPTQPHLAKQDATTVKPGELTALSPEVVRCVPVCFVWMDLNGARAYFAGNRSQYRLLTHF